MNYCPECLCLSYAQERHCRRGKLARRAELLAILPA